MSNNGVGGARATGDEGACVLASAATATAAVGVGDAGNDTAGTLAFSGFAIAAAPLLLRAGELGNAIFGLVLCALASERSWGWN